MTKDEALTVALTVALEALENSVDLVREDAYKAEKLYGNYPTRQGKVGGLKVLADDHEKAIAAIREALAQEKPTAWVTAGPHTVPLVTQPEQKPVAWMAINEYGEEDDIHYENPEGHLLEGWTYKPLYAHPPQIQQAQSEPLEYWNAVEGWVKIDEVREHFDSVGCGTIYKAAGENRVPLFTSPPQRQPLTEDIVNLLYAHLAKDERTKIFSAQNWFEAGFAAAEAAHNIGGAKQ